MPAPYHWSFYRPDAFPDAQHTVSKHWGNKSPRVERLLSLIDSWPTRTTRPPGLAFTLLTSSSAIAERPCDACTTLNRKPVKNSVCYAEICRHEWFLKGIAHFRCKGTSPTNHCWVAENQKDCPFMWYKNIVDRFFGLVTKHACDGRTDRITTPKTTHSCVAL